MLVIVGTQFFPFTKGGQNQDLGRKPGKEEIHGKA
jgi:hypothetical protein